MDYIASNDKRVDQIFLKQKRKKSSDHFPTPVLLVVAKLTEHFVHEQNDQIFKYNYGTF